MEPLNDSNNNGGINKVFIMFLASIHDFYKRFGVSSILSHLKDNWLIATCLLAKANNST